MEISLSECSLFGVCLAFWPLKCENWPPKKSVILRLLVSLRLHLYIVNSNKIVYLVNVCSEVRSVRFLICCTPKSNVKTTAATIDIFGIARRIMCSRFIILNWPYSLCFLTSSTVVYSVSWGCCQAAGCFIWYHHYINVIYNHFAPTWRLQSKKATWRCSGILPNQFSSCSVTCLASRSHALTDTFTPQ